VRVLVTGASGAFGAATCAALRERGAAVAGLDVRPGPDVVECDIRDGAAVERAVAQAVRRLGGLDVLVNAAGIGRATDAGAPPDEDVQAVLDVNFLGAWRVTAAALDALLARRGRVVNVASGLAAVNVPLAAAYSASKRALSAWSDALRLEYAGRLDVVVVNPATCARRSTTPPAPAASAWREPSPPSRSGHGERHRGPPGRADRRERRVAPLAWIA
jgi:NAD(P)-dependent dehydrogenase (short-subunit alcohol dehydrogenase family)